METREVTFEAKVLFSFNIDKTLTIAEARTKIVEELVRNLSITDRIESGELYDDGRMIVLYGLKNDNLAVDNEIIGNYREDLMEISFEPRSIDFDTIRK